MNTHHPKILCLFSAPLLTPDGDPMVVLNVEVERDTIARELASCNRQISVRIGFATIDELAKGIGDGFNILHWSGHGHPDFLLFEDGRGGSQPVKGDYLKKLIATGGPFELAIVSACHSEEVAKMMVDAGIRHVIAIKCDVPVLDHAATAFIGQFYRNLFRKDSIQKAFEMAKLLVEGNPELMRIKPQLELIACEKGEPFIAEEDKFVLLPTSDPSAHLNPLISENIPEGVLSIEAPKSSKTNLPGRPQSFTGRSIEMHTLINELLANRLLTITGAGGIGKTTLMMEVARWFHSRRHFPDGIFHINLRQANTGSGIIGMLGATLELPLTETKDAIEYLRKRQCLLLFDNIEEVLWRDEDATQEIINAILKYAPNVKLLITSQRHVGGNLHEPERIYRLPPMKQNYAALLFLVTAKRRILKQEWESDTFQALLEQLGGHPLSIVLMGRQLVPGASIEDLIERIKVYKAKAIMVKKITERDPEHGESLVATLLSAYNNLSQNAKTLFQILSMLPAGAQKFTIERIMGERAWEYAQEIHDSGLSEITPNPHIFLLPPVRLFAQGILTDSIKEDYGPKIVELMGLYAKQFYEHLGAKDAKEHRFYFIMEEPNLRFAVNLPCSPPKTNKESSALGILSPHLLSLYIFNDRHKEAKKVGDKMISNLRKLGDLVGEANTLKALGDLAVRTANLKDAKEKYEKALGIFQQIDAKLGEANTLKALGDLAVRTANLKDAKEKYEKALGIFQQIDAKLGEANTLMRLGQWFALKGELDHADNNLGNAFMIYEKIDELEGQADVHMGRALIHLKSHADARAKQELDQCSSIRNIVYAHGEVAQWLIFYADHLKSLGFGTGVRICLDYAREFACKAQAPHLQNQIKQRFSEVM